MDTPMGMSGKINEVSTQLDIDIAITRRELAASRHPVWKLRSTPGA